MSSEYTRHLSDIQIDLRQMMSGMRPAAAPRGDRSAPPRDRPTACSVGRQSSGNLPPGGYAGRISDSR